MSYLPFGLHKQAPATQPRERGSVCCARCRRGTRALPGGCAYLMVGRYCPNPACAHARPTTRALDDGTGGYEPWPG